MNNPVCKIYVVTFLRGNEFINESFSNLILDIQKCQNFTVKSRIYTETKNFEANGIQRNIFTDIIVQPRQTKFKRIVDMLKNTDSDYILCIDSDIAIDIENVRGFLSQSIANKYDLAWGRILCYPINSVVKQSVQVDKILSHYIIRPLLWKCNVGVTIPGQIMLIRREAFLNELCSDTFLDDIALGIYARQHKLNTHYASEVLGYEEPSNTILELFQQRRRWANGFSTILKNYYKSSIIIYLLIHVFAYHFLIPALTFTIIALSFFYPIQIGVFIIAGMISTSLLLGYQYALQFLAYPGIFTCLHIEWWLCICYNLLFRKQQKSTNRLSRP
jgi:cellulose synthase/poly-beta-1,6-N-acetylglucosamine synthase-like glycosyltransferase